MNLFTRIFNLRSSAGLILLAMLMTGTGCHTPPQSGSSETRRGDEIVVAGKFVHTGTPVVLWLDPGGYDGYRVERRFSAYDKSDWKTSTAEVKDLKTPNRYNVRSSHLSDGELEEVRGGGWDLPLLQRTIDQFVIHYDVDGLSSQCFRTLHDFRDLSVHFMLDIDGTIYQTLDLKERAAHATIANGRSVGIEIANVGAYRTNGANPFDKWYKKDATGRVHIIIPPKLGDGRVRTKHFVGYPAEPQLVRGQIQGAETMQYNYTPQQYAALVKLTAALCTVLPKIACDYPKEPDGKAITHKLPDDDLDKYHGVLGHYHIQTNKTDPGPAFDWEYVIGHARAIMEQNGARTNSVAAK